MFVFSQEVAPYAVSVGTVETYVGIEVVRSFDPQPHCLSPHLFCMEETCRAKRRCKEGTACLDEGVFARPCLGKTGNEVGEVPSNR